MACEGKNERIYNFPDTINVDLRENYSLVAEFMNTGDCKLYLNGDATASRRPYFVTLYDKTLIQSKEAIFSIKNGTNDVKTNNFSYQIEFKKPIDVATINTDNIYIEQDDGTKVAINIKLDAQNSNTDSTIYNVTATQPLLNGTYYSLIMKDVKDSSGNELSDQKPCLKPNIF